ncbi:MAG: type IX secretion system sortase PorU [Bacteroidia bacterium]|nr:type IX secretion system sortase PorU [Bacteroidia bacterium]
MKTISNLSILVVIVLVPFIGFAQISGETISLKWHTKGYHESFLGCGFREIKNQVYPIYYDHLQIQNTAQRIELFNSVYVVDDNQYAARADYIKRQKTQINQFVTYEKGKPVLNIEVFPYRVSTSGQIEKLIRFQYKIKIVSQKENKQKLGKVSNFKDQSVLANGTWFKFKITQEGIHKITGEQLKNLSIDVANIDARTIKVFGHKGGMLSEIIEDERTDDLGQMAVELIDVNGNNRMDADDYIRFYAQPAGQWKLNANHFSFEKNLYSDNAFIYLTFDGSAAKKLTISPSGKGGPSQTTVDYFYQVVHRENDEVNFMQSGRIWYGDEFRVRTSQRYSHTFSNVRTDLQAHFSHRFAARTIGTNSLLNLSLNGQSWHTKTFSTVSGDYDDTYGYITSKSGNFEISNETVNINYEYNPNGGEGNAWIDYYTLEVPVALTLSGNQTIVRSKEGEDFSNVKYVFDDTGYNIWNVTNYFNSSLQEVYTENGKNTAILFSDKKQVDFVLFKDGSETKAEFVGKVQNQNLHGYKDNDFIIISHADFIEQSNRLAELHRNEYQQNVLVVDCNDIYNEFSAGKQDPTAIRDFIRMFYSRGQLSGNELEHVLLMGDGSYDYKNRIENNTNYIPTFQSRNTTNPTNSYSSDDFYAILDEAEGHYDVDLSVEGLDIGIGRIPCRNLDQAKTMVDKIIHYHDVASFGDWVNRVTLLGDDEDYGVHVKDSETAFSFVNDQEPVFNVNKIYLDAYEQQSFGSGEKYPDVNIAVTKSFERGTLVFNYIGHGGPSGMAHERVVTRPEIREWDNLDRLALMVTATCELSRFDDPAQDSPGELMLFNKNGGAIGLVTTMRLVRITLNRQISARIWDDNIVKVNGGVQFLGETFINSKNRSSMAVNLRNFSLLADPAMKLAIPEQEVVTTHINDSLMGRQIIDTLKAFSRIKISGEIRTLNGVLDSTFNGIVYPTVFDKFIDYQTLANDPDKSVPVDYQMQNSIVYRGKVSVVAGKFSFVFVVPKDISYHFGNAKISYFAENGSTTAAGYENNAIIGGSLSELVDDQTGPKVSLFMNDDSWVFGGTTDPSPTILCRVFDENGINTLGNGIGRDITAILDAGTKNEKTIILNEFYQAALDSYQEGEIKYNLEDLPMGKHTLKVRVWDVYNNVAEDNTEFFVVGDETLIINNLLNFPNPFTTNTEFHFDHNKAGQNIDVLIQIVTPTGRIVKSITTAIPQVDSHFDQITWNGKDEFGDQLARGVYLYKVTVKSEDGQTANASQKLVILK